jgi:hypothetical protein
LTGKKDEIIIRCPFCGDSAKDPHKGHFYIMNKAPFKYYCQRCQSKGIVNSQLLQKINVFDYEVVNMVNQSFRDYQKKLTIKYGSELNFFSNRQLKFYPNQYTGLENSKIKYLEDRLDIVLEEKDVETYKLILNVKDFLTNNNIDINKRLKTPKDKDLFNKVQNHTIGFLTADKNTIICRSLDTEKTGFRYHNYSLFPDNVESKKFFTVKKNLDLSLPEHKIIMTEGIIDVIGVHNHVYSRDDESLYVSNNGKSFLFVLDYLASLSLLNVNIEIYSDKDVNLKFYEYIMKNNRLAKFNGLNIFYNKIGKDYGVKSSEILVSEGISLI